MKKLIYDPLSELISYFSSQASNTTEENINESSLPIEEKLKQRIINGKKNNIEQDLDFALEKYDPFEIINNILLDGMKVVGDLFGSGQMQLPFVLQSAEVMKKAVSYLEQFIKKEDQQIKGTLILATVKGDVHDIGKNLVDIILTNNGYKVVNLGIKVPVEEMLNAYKEHKADAIGMSGLLVKSTLIMKENLEIIKEQGLDIPVVLGGAALTRRFVEEDLRKIYGNKVFYAKDAIDGLNFMDNLVNGRLDLIDIQDVDTNVKVDNEISLDDATGLEAKFALIGENLNVRSDVKILEQVPIPPFYGVKIVENIDLNEVFKYINTVALFRAQWQFKKKGKTDEEYNKLLNDTVFPIFENIKKKIIEEKLLEPKVVYGYFPCNSDGNDLIIYKPKALSNDKLYTIWDNINDLEEYVRFSFPRQVTKKNLCISDYFLPKDSNKYDVIPIQIVTMGKIASDYSKKLFDEHQYQDYLFFHGISVETAEALAEYWHKKIREELNIANEDSNDVYKLFQQGYRGSRYSFGYPACPELADEEKLFTLLKPERIGLELTEGFQIVPEQSTSAIIVHHPQAKYFFL
jgi:5-methyltetrahydrofolate--homocysteine methyltransferase